MILNMKKLCIVVHVFKGEYTRHDYKEFIPLFVYFCLKHYPEYDIRVYTDEPLPPFLARQLEWLRDMGNFEIIENYCVDGLYEHKNADVGKAMRWLYYDEVFEEYDALYVGDVDVLICREDAPLYEQHKAHCRFLGLPYSNIVRDLPVVKATNSRYLIKCIIQHGFRETTRYMLKDMSGWFRLSGLHFIETKSYYEKVRSAIPIIVEEMNQLLSRRSPYWNLCCPPFNEHVLYRLVQYANLGLPPRITLEEHKNTSSQILDTQRYDYRPHHGLHLGLFRSKEQNAVKTPFLLEPAYLDYYRQFNELSREDERLQKLITNASPLITDTLTRMRDFYQRH